MRWLLHLIILFALIMKTKVFKVAVLAVFGLIAGINVYQSQTEIGLSDIQLENVEALADKTPTSTHTCVRGDDYCALFIDGEKVFESFSFYRKNQ